MAKKTSKIFKNKNQEFTKLKIFIQKNQKIFLILFIVALLMGGNYLIAFAKEQRQVVRRKAAMEKQNQIMQEFWNKKGLNQEQMQEKMKQGRGNFNGQELTDEQKAEMKQKMEERNGGSGFNPGAVRERVIKIH